MTTIIAVNTHDEQALYADSFAFGAGIGSRGNVKMICLAPEIIMAWAGVQYVGFYAGHILQGIDLQEVFAFGLLLPRLELPVVDVKDFAALVLFGGKIWVVHEELFPVVIPQQYAARGSGSKFALGALAAGVPTLRALDVATEFDPDTQPPYMRMDLSGTLTLVK